MRLGKSLELELTQELNMENRETTYGLLPTVKCSNCGSQIEISYMGEHICGPASQGKFEGSSTIVEVASVFADSPIKIQLLDRSINSQR